MESITTPFRNADFHVTVLARRNKQDIILLHPPIRTAMAPLHSPTLRTLPGSRWSCRSCGHCCRSFELGPVEPATHAALVAADPAAMWPAAAEQPWFHERRGPDGKPGIWLSRRNGACIFLGEDNLCAIHGLLGERYKPAFCREFPFHVVRENTHWTAVVRPGCAGLWASRIDGQPVEEQLADLPGLPRAYPLPRFAPGHVQLMPGVGISLDSWYAAEPALMHVLDAPHEEPEATVAQLRDALGRAISRQLPAPDPHAYREAMRTVLRRIRQALAAQEPPADTQDAREVLLQSSLDWLSRAQSRCGAKGWPTSTDGRAYLNLVLRTNVYGKLFHRMGGLPRAMGLFLLDLHLARSVAAPNADGEIEPRAASGVLVPWWNLCSHGAVVEVLRHSGASLTTLYMNVEGA